MTLNKNTQMILGVGAVAIVGYLLWKNNQSSAVASTSSTSFAGPVGGNPVGIRRKINATGTSRTASSAMLGCPCAKTPTEYVTAGDIKLWHCPGGQWCENVAAGVPTDGVPPRSTKAARTF